MTITEVLFAILVTAAFIALLWRLEEGYWPTYHLNRWYRRFVGRCVKCGKTREQHAHCFHCAASVYYEWHVCHRCAKTLNLARAYGYKDDALYRVCTTIE